MKYYLKDTVATEEIKVKMVLSTTGIKIFKTDGTTEVTTDYSNFKLFKKGATTADDAAIAGDILLKNLSMDRITSM